ncbi:TPA: 4Fe-4S binding protein [Methanopyrus kandleri]|uniref:4Fe-4S binding protein n=1 Tax=Methanopyrus kandleri TaxID=2320 RepID=A0A832WMB1_9EURY|nr:4Fe-4S binding protein [Methanopyrus kandleri]
MYRDFREFRPDLEFRACVACGECAAVCPAGSLELRKGPVEAFCATCRLCEDVEVSRLPSDVASLLCPIAFVQRIAERLLPHPWIRESRCTGCGLCVERCPVEALRLEEGRAVVEGDCELCGTCWDICPVVDCIIPPAAAVREVFLGFSEASCVDCGLCVETCPFGWGKGHGGAVGSGRGVEPRARAEARGHRRRGGDREDTRGARGGEGRPAEDPHERPRGRGAERETRQADQARESG